jgi:uncharacterized repeat protein (TIGR03809 family)
MTELPAHQEFGRIAQKWRELAERRRGYFSELYSSGRWKLYYTEEELLVRMRDVTGICERWANLAPDSVAAEAPASAPQPERRDAA